MKTGLGSRRAPSMVRSGWLMNVPAAVQRCGRVGEHLVVGDVVAVHVITRGTDNDRRADTEVADDRGHGDVEHVVAEPAAVGPAAWHDAVAEALLNLAGERVAAED